MLPLSVCIFNLVTNGIHITAARKVYQVPFELQNSSQSASLSERVAVAPSGYECDFCSSRPVLKIFSCRNFLIPWTKTWAFQHESNGGWAACRTCAELIDTGQWQELSNRALRAFVELHGLVNRLDEPLLRQQFRELHHLFREHMTLES